MATPISRSSPAAPKGVLSVLDKLFTGLIDSTTGTMGASGFLLCIIAALILGALLALTYTFKTVYTRSFITSLALLPAIVALVIMMVSGNIGAGVAVAGTFSLVRFRSAPGSAKEICAVFLSMAVGIACGMGYIGYALVFSILMAAVYMLYTQFSFGVAESTQRRKTLRITIPEDLDYGGVFDDLFDRYTTACALQSVKTTNMGSLFRLTYNLTLKNAAEEKSFIDALRCRNGNLEISSSVQSTVPGEL